MMSKLKSKCKSGSCQFLQIPHNFLRMKRNIIITAAKKIRKVMAEGNRLLEDL